MPEKNPKTSDFRAEEQWVRLDGAPLARNAAFQFDGPQRRDKACCFRRRLIKERAGRSTTYEHMCVCVSPLQSAPNSEDGPSRKHRPGPPNSKDELHSPPGNGAEKWRRDGQSGMGGQ